MSLQNLFYLLLWLYSHTVIGQLTVIVNSLPINTPENPSIFVAGNFQDWNPADENHQFAEENGVYTLTFTPSIAALEFKFTRGSWDTVEGNENGGFLPNRQYNYAGGIDTLWVDILSWEDVGGTNSTAAYNVSILENEFFIPQLNRSRRIWLYLPPDYAISNKNYPVLYMHDGQNIFDDATSFAGEWEVDESLNELFSQGDYGCIVVAIDNGGSERLNEYSPWVNADYGGGQGDEYADFIANTLKPYIDINYRTLPQAFTTGIMGSSMGGLISLYTGIEYQETFGKIGSFSPAYWFSDEVYTYVETHSYTSPLKIYTIAGALEGGSMTNGVNAMEVTLEDVETMELATYIHADGQHSEWYWAREFAEAYTWLFGDIDFDAIDTAIESVNVSTLSVYPNPCTDFLQIEGVENWGNIEVVLYDISGKAVLKDSDNVVDMTDLEAGIYFGKVGDFYFRVVCEN